MNIERHEVRNHRSWIAVVAVVTGLYPVFDEEQAAKPLTLWLPYGSGSSAECTGEHLPHGAVRVFPGPAPVDAGRRGHAARSCHDERPPLELSRSLRRGHRLTPIQLVVVRERRHSGRVRAMISAGMSKVAPATAMYCLPFSEYDMGAPVGLMGSVISATTSPVRLS